MNKVALLFSGQLRGFPYSYPTIKQYFEAIFTNCDIYYVFNILQTNYTVETIVKNQKQIIAQKVWQQDPVDEIHKFCIPNGIGGWSQFHSHINQNTVHDNKFKHFMLQWYFVQGAYSLISDISHTFDYIVRIRPDLFFYQNILNIYVDSLDDKTIIVPQKFDFGGICDRLAIGRPDAMKIYSDFYNTCNIIPGNSETRLATWLAQNNIKVIKHDIEFCHINHNKQFTYCLPSTGNI